MRASSARTMSETRWLRRDSFFMRARTSISDVNELVAIGEQLAVQILLHEAKDVLEERIERLLVGADRRHPQLRPLQQVLVADLRRRDPELVANAGLEALDDHALFLQAAAAWEVDVENGVGEDHGA